MSIAPPHPDSANVTAWQPTRAGCGCEPDEKPPDSPQTLPSRFPSPNIPQEHTTHPSFRLALLVSFSGLSFAANADKLRSTLQDQQSVRDRPEERQDGSGHRHRARTHSGRLEHAEGQSPAREGHQQHGGVEDHRCGRGQSHTPLPGGGEVLSSGTAGKQLPWDGPGHAYHPRRTGPSCRRRRSKEASMRRVIALRLFLRRVRAPAYAR